MPGRVSTYSVTNGRIDGGAIAFDFSTSANYRFSGTLTATRMSGTFTIIDFPESGRFAVTRQ